MEGLQQRRAALTAISGSLLVAAELGRHGPGAVASVMVFGAALVVFASLRTASGLAWTHHNTLVLSAWVFASVWMLTLIPPLVPTVMLGLATCAIMTVIFVKTTPRISLRRKYRQWPPVALLYQAWTAIGQVLNDQRRRAALER
jgi:hypothetical protein